MNIKALCLIGAFAFAAPVVAVAAPASGLTAHSYADVTTAPAVASDAAVLPGDPTAKVEKVWYRRGWGWRGRGWRGYGWRGYGWRRPVFRGYYGWRRPYWRRRWYY